MEPLFGTVLISLWGKCTFKERAADSWELTETGVHAVVAIGKHERAAIEARIQQLKNAIYELDDRPLPVVQRNRKLRSYLEELRRLNKTLFCSYSPQELRDEAPRSVS